MKRKYYKYDYEIKADRKAGFFAFPIINGVVWFASWLLSSGVQSGGLWGLLLPWIANGLILLVAVIFRPEFAVGYLTFISAAIIAVFVLGIIFVGGCFLAIGVGLIFTPLGPLAGFVAIGVFLAILVAGLAWAADHAIRWYDNWTFAWDKPKPERPDYPNPLPPIQLSEESTSTNIPDGLNQLPDTMFEEKLSSKPSDTLNQSAETWFNQPSGESPSQDDSENESNTI